ncbi:hypothetical protein ElyMa_005301800 [Elysia marginata]|uniref:Uncharacterized protein n=1 Tax=Elysia marginata TaxID=1093978 RepID=A0AAV4K0H8_9GAST|nr:hypothetical protein ElyMa_005301800 [Elysia marginata]
MDFGGKNTVTSRRVVRDVKFRTSRSSSSSSTPTSPGANGPPQSPKKDLDIPAPSKKDNSLDPVEQKLQTTRSGTQEYRVTHKTVEQRREVSQWSGYLDKGAVTDVSQNGGVVRNEKTGSGLGQEAADAEVFIDEGVRTKFVLFFFFLWYSTKSNSTVDRSI